jgi:hypothetical protein
LLIFGSGELIFFKEKIYIYGITDICVGYIAYALQYKHVTIIALSILFSSSRKCYCTIITTIAVLIVSLILSHLNIGFLKNLQPFYYKLNKLLGIII